MTGWFHTHAHSEFSCLDGMNDIGQMVAKAAKMGQPAMGLTDHGNMAGAFTLYKECRAHGIKPFPGTEMYVVSDTSDKDASRYHLTLMAYTTQGYQNLVELSTVSHLRRNFHRFPRLGLDDLAHAANEGRTAGIACLTGCHFGMVQQALDRNHFDSTAKAHRIVAMLASWFPGATFVEVQHHHTPRDPWAGPPFPGPRSDDLMVLELHRIAESLGLPMIASQDCHYLDKSQRDAHSMMKGVSYGQPASEAAYPGDSYHMASEDWVHAHYRDMPDVWDRCMDGAAELLDLNDLTIPVIDDYKYVVPKPLDMKDTLTDLCVDALDAKELMDKEGYTERLAYELGVVRELAMEDYFLLVHDYVSWCVKENILVMARGSAAGSLICFLLGFTQVDPLLWGLTFDRFLTPDRIRPPDIDLDIEDTRRPDVVEYLSKKYDLTQIGTFGRMGFDEETGKGSVIVKYLSGQRRRMKKTGEDYQEVYGYSAPHGPVTNLNQLAKIEPGTARLLKEVGGLPLRSAPGAHAAGFVLSQDGLRVTDWIPTMLIASSETTVTQMMMDDVEDAGFVKIDLLGLRSLSTMAKCLELLGLQAGDLSWIPLDDGETFKMLRKGKPGIGVFQLEGYSAARGCKEIKPRSIRDLIYVNALYRPATMDHGYTATFVERRNGSTENPYVPLHPIFDKHLKETYGVPVFQEQVLAILRELGMPTDKLNDFLTAVKGKHATAGYSDKSDALVAGARDDFDTMCLMSGMTEHQTNEGWALVEGFAAYGFNRAHATAYSIFGYQLAYLKVHHPLEFHCALLATTSGDKMKAYVDETRRCKQRILRADVNISGAGWTVDRDAAAIRRGIGAIKGIGEKAAVAIAEAAPFESMADLIDRTPARVVSGGKKWETDGELIGKLALLKESNALRSLGVLPG